MPESGFSLMEWYGKTGPAQHLSMATVPLAHESTAHQDSLASRMLVSIVGQPGGVCVDDEFIVA